MGRKSSAKGQTPAPPPSAERRSNTRLIVAAHRRRSRRDRRFRVLATALAWRCGVNGGWLGRGCSSPISAADYGHRRRTRRRPSCSFPAYPTSRPQEVVRAAYQFAADHPEVLSYVPCFCGCERAGHRGNEDCFVRERAVNGDVIAWDDHGMECAVCLDVADRSRKLFAEGKSVAEIRSTIEKEFGTHGPSHTPTPQPPAKSGS